jgi:hypothetical protein
MPMMECEVNAAMAKSAPNSAAKLAGKTWAGAMP